MLTRRPHTTNKTPAPITATACILSAAAISLGIDSIAVDVTERTPPPGITLQTASSPLPLKLPPKLHNGEDQAHELRPTPPNNRTHPDVPPFQPGAGIPGGPPQHHNGPLSQWVPPPPRQPTRQPTPFEAMQLQALTQALKNPELEKRRKNEREEAEKQRHPRQQALLVAEREEINRRLASQLDAATQRPTTTPPREEQAQAAQIDRAEQAAREAQDRQHAHELTAQIARQEAQQRRERDQRESQQRREREQRERDQQEAQQRRERDQREQEAREQRQIQELAGHIHAGINQTLAQQQQQRQQQETQQRRQAPVQEQQPVASPQTIESPPQAHLITPSNRAQRSDEETRRMRSNATSGSSIDSPLQPHVPGWGAQGAGGNGGNGGDGGDGGQLPPGAGGNGGDGGALPPPPQRLQPLTEQERQHQLEALRRTHALRQAQLQSQLQTLWQRLLQLPPGQEHQRVWAQIGQLQSQRDAEEARQRRLQESPGTGQPRAPLTAQAITPPQITIPLHPPNTDGIHRTPHGYAIDPLSPQQRQQYEREREQQQPTITSPLPPTDSQQPQ